MIPLRILRIGDRFELAGIEYRKIRPTRITGLGVVNIQNVASGIKSYMSESVDIVPNGIGYLYRRVPILTKPFVR